MLASSNSSASGDRSDVSPERIEAIVSLLGDDDEKIVKVVWDELEKLGRVALPILRQASRESDDERVRIRTRRFLKEWSRREVFREWVHFCRSDNPDLETGCFLICRTEEPHCDVDTCVRALDDYASTLRHRLAQTKSIDDALKKICAFLFHENGYHGNAVRYYEADNSYLNRVIDRKLGIPITLAVILLLVCRRLSFDVYGVSFPQHFLVKFRGDSGERFVDVFHGGRILTVRDCAQFLESIKLEFREEYLVASTDQQILARMLNNLFRVYWDEKDHRRANRVAAMLKLLS